MEEVISSGIKDYIIACRKNNISDSQIIDALKKSKWPEDIINQAIKQADLVAPAVKETQKEAQQTTSQNTQTQNQQTNISNNNFASNNTTTSINTSSNLTTQAATQTSVSTQSAIADDLFTKPPILVEEKPKIQEKPKKVFSPWVIVALILSPIPLIGLGVSMSVLDYVNKNNYSGKIIAYLSLIISLSVILYILYIIYQIFTLDTAQLTGFSKFIVEKFNLM